jgi:hypothetical protein
MLILIVLKIEEKQGKSRRLNEMFSCAYVVWTEKYERSHKLNKNICQKMYNMFLEFLLDI